jgi:PAS domain S-box-containing protein
MEEKKCHSALELAPYGYAFLEPVHDEQGKIIDMLVTKASPKFLDTICEAHAQPCNCALSELIPDLMIGNACLSKLLSCSTGNYFECFCGKTNKWIRFHLSIYGENQYIIYSEDITETKASEEILKETNERLQIVMNNIPQFIFWKDRNSVLLGCNENFARVAGVESPEDIAGKTDYDLVWKKEESDFFRECDERVMSSGKAEYKIVEPQLQADGKQAWLETNKIPLFDEHGNVTGILGTFEDITQRVEAEQKLKEQEERLRYLLDNMSDVLFTCDLNYQITYISPSIKRLTGDTPEENMSKSLAQKHTPESAQKVRDAVMEEFEKEKDPSEDKNRSRLIESQMYRKDGSIIDVASNVKFIRDENGLPIGTLGVIRDISGRKLAERKAAESFQRANAMRTAIAELILDKSAAESNVEEALKHICKTVAHSLDIQRVSVWDLNEGNTELKCLVKYNTVNNTFHSGTILETSLYPEYFHALLSETRINATDAQNDPRTSELTRTYLRPEGISSMLDAGILSQGKLIGVVCCEHSGEMRNWLPDEESFISTVAALVAQIFSNAERRKAEEALSQSNNRLLTVMNSIPAFIYIADIKTCELLFINEYGQNAWGKNITGQKCWKVLQGKDGPCEFCTNDQLLDSEDNPKGIYQWEFLNQVNGKWYDIRDCAIHWTDGRLVRMEIAIDITERKQAERELLDSEENLRITLNSIGDAVIATDTKGMITRMNPVAEQLTGWTIDEATGKSVTEILHIINSKTRRKAGNPVEKVLKTGKTVGMANHTLLLSKDGLEYQIADSAAPIKDNNGTVAGVVMVFRDVTSEYAAAMAITESERKYRELYKNLMDGSASVDLDGKVTQFNKAFQDLIGYEEREIYQLTYEDITPGKWHQTERKIIEEQVLRRGYSDLYEKEYIRKDGTVFPVELTTYLIHDENRNPKGYWAIIRDISERKQNEKMIMLNAERSEALLEIGYMYDSSLSEITDYALEKAVEITQSSIGYLAFLNEDETVLSMHAWSAQAMKQCEIKDKPITYNVEETGLWGEAVRQRKPIITNDYTSESKWKKGYPEGHVAIVRHMNTPVFDHDKIVIVAGVGNKAEDYTDNDVQQLTLLMQGMWRIIERKRTQDKLKVFMESLHNSTDAIGMSDPEGKHYYHNHAFESLFGNVGENPPETLYVDKSVGDEVFSVITSGGSWTGEVQMYSKDQRILDVYLRAYSVKDARGNVSAVVGIHTDITERKMAEKALVEAKEKAEESDRLKSVFLANVSHEIRTPMNAILGFLELLKDQNLTSQKKTDYISIVNQSGKRLLNTINDIIEISKIESGQADVMISEVNVQEVLKFHFDFFRQQCREKGLLLRLSEYITGDRAKILTDRHKLDGILTNLINNAIKFTPEGSVEFGNRIENGNLLFYVRDTGVGIPENRLNAIFERFVQADVHNTRAHEGSGLGLSIVKAYLEILNGKIWLESEEKKGTAFYFQIPYNPVIKEKELNIFDNSHNRTAPIRKKTILVAEDNDFNYVLIENILNDDRFYILRAKNGTDVLKYLEKITDISLILIDINMPGMNGYETTRLIRQMNVNIPIIVQSAYAFGGEREKAIEAGCNDYIVKPINKSELMKLIHLYLNLDE